MFQSAEIPVNTSNSNTVNFLLAEVIAKGDDHYLVKHGQQCSSARCASSFLFVPEIHDQVLLIATEQGAFINQIVQRCSDTPLELRITKALSIQGLDAQLHCNVELLSLAGQALIIEQQHLQIDSDQVNLNWQETTLEGQHCQLTVEQMTVKSGLCDAMIDTLTVKAKHVLHWIEELKQQMLGRLHISVQKHYQLDCDSVDIYSQKDVKIDAKQIHLG